MTEEEIYERLNGVFRDVFDDESISVNGSTTAKDVEGWDSLMHITLISGVEEEFGVRLDMKDIVGLKSVGEMADLIRKLSE